MLEPATPVKEVAPIADTMNKARVRPLSLHVWALPAASMFKAMLDALMGPGRDQIEKAGLCLLHFAGDKTEPVLQEGKGVKEKRYSRKFLCMQRGEAVPIQVQR